MVKLRGLTPCALILPATCATLIGCAGQATYRWRDEYTPTQSTTAIRVENRNWRAVDVFVLLGGARSRIGRVEALSSAELPLPPNFAIGVLRVAIRPMGSPHYFATESVTAYAGTKLQLVVASRPEQSVLSNW
jgi:hypothetical protein